jgi:hypothetical protein
MRYLIYALQSSGASLFTYLLAQKPFSIGIVDLYNGELAPSYNNFNEKDIFLKCTVSLKPSLEDHISSFQPHKTICFSRDYLEIRESLSKKFHANLGGKIDDKINLFENYKNTFKFDYYINYFEMVAQTLPEDLVNQSYYSFPRSLLELTEFNSSNAWCKKYAHQKWSLGNIHTDKSTSAHSQFHKLTDTKVYMEE